MANIYWLPALTTIESLLKIFVYITIITVGWKLMQVMNHYINKK